MERGLLYSVIFVGILIIVLTGSIRNGFHPARFALSLIAVFFIPGLTAAFISGLKLLTSRNDIWLPVLLGSLTGIVLYKVIFKKLHGFSTFEHELSHAIVALLFFRKIKKFVVTRNNGGYIEYSDGFGGNVANYFVSLGPYFLPTFTLFSVLIRPVVPAGWFPVYDFWIGITFLYQLMNNVDEIKRNWTKERFRMAGKNSYTESDIAKEGYIFSFIMILALKLFIMSLLLFMLVYGYSSVADALKVIWIHSAGFFQSVFAEIFSYLGKL